MNRNSLVAAIALSCTALLPTPALANAEPATALAPEQGGEAATLEITFANLAAPEGQILLALFDSEASYATGSTPVLAITIPVEAQSASITLPDLPEGRYAFRLFHDVDGDGEMDTNPFGMPIEPFAFSNNGPANMGPATWDAASFDLAGPTVQSIAFR